MNVINVNYRLNKTDDQSGCKALDEDLFNSKPPNYQHKLLSTRHKRLHSVYLQQKPF